MRMLCGCILGFVLLLAAAPASQAQMEYQVNFVLGQKMLEEDDWQPAETQAAFGVTSTFGGENWPVHIAIDLVGSVDERTEMGMDLQASTSEFDIGIRKIWGQNKVRPFLGGGLAAINGMIEVEGMSFDDTGIGGWINGGVFWRLGKRFNIGFEARVSRAEITLFGIDGEAGGETLGLVLGFGKAR